MLHISFYLLNPSAKDQSPLYVSISNKKSRLRFAAGENFLTKYCNVRYKKGGKDLIKRNTPFYIEYNSLLQSIYEQLLLIEIDVKKANKEYTLENIRDRYWQDIGRVEDENNMPFLRVFDQYLESNRQQWTPGFVKIQQGLKKHFETFEEKTINKLDFNTFTDTTWQHLANYFIGTGMQNSSTNKCLKFTRQFLRFASKKGYFKNMELISDCKPLQQSKSFKISLKEHEVNTLINLDLSDNEKLDKVRDLFLLEVFTGQRYSDVEKVLDRRNYDGKFIRIYQQKTKELVSIPIHSELERHLAVLLKKYPFAFPTLSNQKFNEYLKELGERAGFKQTHQWIKLVGSERIEEQDLRYNLITTHTGRRTFCTIAKRRGIADDLIMKVTGHKKYEQYMEYVQTDDEDIESAFSKNFTFDSLETKVA